MKAKPIQPKQLKGIIPFEPYPITLNKQLNRQSFPQSFTQLPFLLVFIMFLSSACKLLLPFTLQYLYHRIQGNQFYLSLSLFMLILMGSYFLQMYGQQLLNTHKLNVRKVLTQRLINNTLTSRKNIHSPNPLWNKITSNINIYVDNYYASILSLVFETGKVMVIVIYLFYKLGVIILAGLFLTGAIIQFTIYLSQHIQFHIFANVKLKELKIQTLRQYLGRVTEFKMCYLDEFVGNRIKEIQNLYQNHLRKNKMLDCWCVGLWQFTSIGISSIVLCCYYALSQTQSDFEPATVIYLFQMLTFPMNVISWNINGVNNAQRALRELNKEQIQFKQQQQHIYQQIKECEQQYLKIKGFKSIDKVQKNRIYQLVCKETNTIKDFALNITDNNTQRVGYGQENGWHMSSLINTLLLKPTFTHQEYQQHKHNIIKYLTYFGCHDIPFQNQVSSYSGGQKMRVTLARAFLLSQVIVVDSDLKSLDHRTRQYVLDSIGMLCSRYDKTVFIRPNTNIHHYRLNLNQQGILQQNSNHNNKNVMQQEHLNKEHMQIIQQKLQLLIQNNNNKEKSSDNNDNNNNKVQLSLKTLLFYYKSGKHIIFLVSIILMVTIGNYYNYYISIYKPNSQNITQHILTLLFITILYILFIYLRSYWFAEANLQENKRICHQTNALVLYNHIHFYSTSQYPQNTQQKLVYACVSDQETVGNGYAFIVNILFNNISTVVGSLVMIGIQVPPMFIIAILLYFLIYHIDNKYRHYNETLKSQEKQSQVQLFKSINLIQQGNFLFKVFKQQSHFKQYFQYHFNTIVNYSFTITLLGIWVRKNYRIMMIVFVIVATLLYRNIVVSQDNGMGYNEAGLALLVRYMLSLAEYVFHFTMSLAQSRASAISIERIRKYAQNPQFNAMKEERVKKVTHKIQIYKSTHHEPIDIEFKDLNFSYKDSEPILKKISMKIKENDRIILRGKSGAGKTTLCKIITQLHPVPQFTNTNYKISFSPQHPLLIEKASVLQNVDPYSLLGSLEANTKNKILKMLQPLIQKAQKGPLSYEEKVLMNNIRTYIYSMGGLAIYDEPQQIINQNQGTYLVITHHGTYPSTNQYQIKKGQIMQGKEQD